jgi:hypothetical protein
MALKDIKARVQARMRATDAVSNVYTYRRNLSAETDQQLLIGRVVIERDIFKFD